MHTDYICRPYWLLDFNLGVDIWATPKLLAYLKGFEGIHVKRIMKSHFSVEFFQDFLPYFTSEFHVFYVMRRHCDTLASFHRFSQSRDWLEAPDVKDVSQFIRARPAGSCLRWQREQYDSMLERWQAHVKGWLVASRSHEIHVIRYEDLQERFECTMGLIAEVLGVDCRRFERPELSGINAWHGGSHRHLYTADDLAYIAKTLEPDIWNLWHDCEERGT